MSAGLILGGVDPAGSHIIQIHPHGSTAKLPYTTMGSGSLAAMSILEDGWKPDLNEEQVKNAIFHIIKLGIFIRKNLKIGYRGTHQYMILQSHISHFLHKK